MPRSGTTLVDKILSSHPEIVVHSQPLPLLYVELKRMFLKERSERPDSASLRYPLNDMFGEHHYPASRFARFLNSLDSMLSPLREISHAARSFSGQLSEFKHQIATECSNQPLSQFLDCYLGVLTEDSPRIVGSKEVFCEEFIPYEVEHRTKVVLILRDIRDVITSLNFGEAAIWSGTARPDLFNIRQWRKSVAFATRYEADDRVHVIRYEDVVQQPVRTIEEITTFLEVSPLHRSILQGELRDQNGEVWEGNSSHSPNPSITSDSIGRYVHHLSPARRAWIEALCLPELRYLNYTAEVDVPAALATIASYVDETANTREELCKYRWTESRAFEETERLALLTEPRFREDRFLFHETFDVLSSMSRLP